jgi:hypothetical protein
MAQEDQKTCLDLYWKMYNEHTTQARHHETLRSVVSAFLFAFAGAIIGLYGKSGSPNASIICGPILVLIGILGAALSYKHYERNRLHVQIAAAFRKEIDEVLSSVGGSVSKPNSVARKKHTSEYPWSSKLRTYQLWMFAFLLVLVYGIFILVNPG